MRRPLTLVSLLMISTALLAQDEPRFQTGLQFISREQYLGIPLATPSFGGVLPERKELAPFATPGRQGAQNSCVGWAVAFALKTYQEAHERTWDPTLAEHQFSPSYIFNQIKVGGCRSGSTFPDALNLLSREGVATLAAFRYDEFECTGLPSPPIRQGALPFRIATWRRVNTLDEIEVKTHLASGFPVLIGMPVDSEFMNLLGDTVYQRFTGPNLGGHAMVVTGYDDQRGAFRVLNSWGPEWADGGSGWISYSGFRSAVLEGYAVQDIIVTPTPPPQIEFETLVMAEVPGGIRSETKTTNDHHCSFNCQGEPTRTNYSVRLTANDGAYLRNPQVRCVAGPCHGWNAVLSVRLENDNRSAVASWDVWASPTTWELSAEEVRLDTVSRFTRRQAIGIPFTVVAETGAPPPRISGRFSTGESFSFIVGRPTGNPRLSLLSFEVQGPETVYRYEAQ